MIFPTPGCEESFEKHSELEIHLEVGRHKKSQLSESLHDKLIRREWAARFSTVDSMGANYYSGDGKTKISERATDSPSNLEKGWALSKARPPVRFTSKVKAYLNAKFDLGEKTGLKADPKQVAADMRNARDEENDRRFSREEWLTKTQIQGYFSRLASARRKKGQIDTTDESGLEDAVGEEEHNNRIQLIGAVMEEIDLPHPVCYDSFDLCESMRKNELSKYNV